MSYRDITALYAIGVYDLNPYPITMSDAVSLGVRAFEDTYCPIGKPAGCVFEGGMIVHDDATGEAVCGLCGTVAPILATVTSPDKNEAGEFVGPARLAKTGAKRGREDAFRRLFGGTEWNKSMQVTQRVEGLSDKLSLSANAQAETLRVFNEMLDAGFHKGGTGLDAVVLASAYFGARHDYNFIPIEKISDATSTETKKARRVIKRARKDRIVLSVTPSAREVLDSHLGRYPHSAVVQEMARKYSDLQIPGLRPSIHASGALYMALRNFGNSKEKRTTQEQVATDFQMSRKTVGQGYRALIEATEVRTNPPKDADIGLTKAQLRLLRRLR